MKKCRFYCNDVDLIGNKADKNYVFVENYYKSDESADKNYQNL